MVDGKKIFIDSSLIDANASLNSIVDKKSLKTQLNKRYKELEARLDEIEVEEKNRPHRVMNNRYVSTTDPTLHTLYIDIIYSFIRMLTDKHIIATTIIVGAFNGIVFGYYSAAPHIFIDLFSITEQHYGMLGVFMAVGVCLGSFLSHRLNYYFDTLKSFATLA